MVVWEYGFSQQDNGSSLGAVSGKCCYKMHQLRLLVDVSRPNPNLFQIFPACPESVFSRFKWRFLLGCQFWGWLLCILMGICITRSWCLVFHNVLCWIGWMDHSSMWSQPMLFWWLRVHRTVRVHERWSGTRDFENWMDTCHRDVNSWMTICKIRRNLFCDLDFIYCCLGYLWINWKPQSTQTTAVIRCEC